MSFLWTLVGLVATGLGVLHALRLAQGRALVDVPLAWFVGSGAFALGVGVVRFVLGVPYTRGVALAIVAAAIVAGWLRSRRSLSSASTPPETCAWPRPAWLFAPLALYVVFVATITVLHGLDTPTQTDDGLRVRAFTPVLAFEDAWSPEARKLLPVAGLLPTWAPTLAWKLTGTLDTFGVNAWIVTTLVMTLALVVGLASTRGRAEEGWAGAFALMSLPLFVFHCTSTYTDAVLAMLLGAGLVFFLEYERTRAPADAGRALLVLACAALVKREGTLLALATAAPLVLLAVLRRRRGERVPWSGVLLLLVPMALDLAIGIGAVGVRDAFPIVKVVLGDSAPPSEGALAPVTSAAAAAEFARALFCWGNAGMLFWVLALVLPLRLPALVRRGGAFALLALGALFGLCALNSIWLLPAYTLDETTVHRALLSVSVPASLWVAATLVRWVREERSATSER